MNVSDEAVEAAAEAYVSQREYLGFTAWSELPEEGREWRRDQMRVALEVAAPYIIQSAAHDLAGADKTSHWDDRYREFEERDGGDLSSDSSAYLDGIGDAMNFLLKRAATNPYRSQA